MTTRGSNRLALVPCAGNPSGSRGEPFAGRKERSVISSAPGTVPAAIGAAGAPLLSPESKIAGTRLWNARDLMPKEQRRTLPAAIEDRRGITRVQ